jgi:hypothetical protein
VGVHHRCFPAVDRADDLLRGDAFEVGAGGREVCVPELALDQWQRDPLTQQLDGVGMAELMRREATPDPSLDREVAQLCADSGG